jgi:hypothetical protein
MSIWLEQIKRDAERQIRESERSSQLKDRVKESRRIRSEAHRKQLEYVESFVPLEEQIQRWWRGLSVSVQQRPFSTRDLVAQLRGRYKQRPAASAVATALRKLGFMQYRDWSKNGQGCRLWSVMK